MDDGDPRLHDTAAHSLPDGAGAAAVMMAAPPAWTGGCDSMDPGTRQLTATAARVTSSHCHLGATGPRLRLSAYPAGRGCRPHTAGAPTSAFGGSPGRSGGSCHCGHGDREADGGDAPSARRGRRLARPRGLHARERPDARAVGGGTPDDLDADHDPDHDRPVTEPPVTPISWSPCNGDLQCGTLVVPLDYADPKGPTIPIAVARHPAEDPAARIGSLVIDPGGPGCPGIDDMANELSSLTPQLLDDFDIVMFDPRGVERSDPVTCEPDAGWRRHATLPDPVPTTPGQQAATISRVEAVRGRLREDERQRAPLRRVGRRGARHGPPPRQRWGTAVSPTWASPTARCSGLTYAALFPTHVRAMVLDGVIDPALTFNQMTAGAGRGLRVGARAFFAWCAGTPSCAWRPAGDPTTAAAGADRRRGGVAGTGRAAARRPAPASCTTRCSTGCTRESDWPELGDALAADAAGNGAPVVAMSDHYNQNGSTNGDDAAVAIDCLDHPVSHDLATYGDLADLAQGVGPGLRAAPRLG